MNLALDLTHCLYYILLSKILKIYINRTSNHKNNIRNGLLDPKLVLKEPLFEFLSLFLFLRMSVSSHFGLLVLPNFPRTLKSGVGAHFV